MPKFREISLTPNNTSEQDISVVDYNRIKTRMQLPATYPFWTNHASSSGIVYLDFDPTVAQVQDGVDIDISEYKYNFSKTPLVLAWFRFANSDLTYSNTTEIYKYPIVRRNTSGVALEAFTMYVDATSKILRFSRRSVSSYGTIPLRIYIKFLMFDDEPFKNPITRTGGVING